MGLLADVQLAEGWTAEAEFLGQKPGVKVPKRRARRRGVQVKLLVDTQPAEGWTAEAELLGQKPAVVNRQRRQVLAGGLRVKLTETQTSDAASRL